MKLIDYQVI